MDVIAGFDAVARQYDEQRRKLVPCFDDFYRLPVALMELPEEPDVLDLGAGTGIFSAFLLERFPKAHVTLADLSEGMLEMARLRFAGNTNVEFLLEDYVAFPFAKKYDAVISALSIHHIAEADKKKLYHKCFDMVKEGGVFVNADLVLEPSPRLDRLYKSHQQEFVRASGLPEKEMEKGAERMKHDDPSTLEEQVRWLRGAGFGEAACVYRYAQFCVTMGWK